MRHAAFARDDAGGAATDAGTPARILIIEDDYLVGSEAENALLQAGFAVVGIAASAEEAAELAAAHNPMLAVVDIRLAGKRDGIDVALELFSRHGIRPVFASAHHGPEARARAAPARPLAWLAKPYSMRALVDTIRRARRELEQPTS